MHQLSTTQPWIIVTTQVTKHHTAQLLGDVTVQLRQRVTAQMVEGSSTTQGWILESCNLLTRWVVCPAFTWVVPHQFDSYKCFCAIFESWAMRVWVVDASRAHGSTPELPINTPGLHSFEGIESLDAEALPHWFFNISHIQQTLNYTPKLLQQEINNLHQVRLRSIFVESASICGVDLFLVFWIVILANENDVLLFYECM